MLVQLVSHTMNTNNMNNSNSLPEWDKHLSTKPRMNIGIAVLLTLIICGIYGLVWQYKQMKILNFWLNKREYTFGMWFLLTIITCGIYGIYNEYKMARSIVEIQEQNNLMVHNVATICLILTLIGLSIVSMAIQQSEINKFYVKIDT